MKTSKFCVFVFAFLLIFTTSFYSLIVSNVSASVTSGPTLVKDITTTPIEFGELNTESMAIFANEIYFSAVLEIGGSDVIGLWKSDGTIGGAGTELVREFDVISADVLNRFMVADDVFYFVVSSGDEYGLWKSDGTSEGTVLVHSEIFDEYKPKLVYNNILYFYGADRDEFDDPVYGVYKSDGTEGGTVLLKTFDQGDELDSSPFVEVEDLIYFIAYTNANGAELWKTDGTTVGTEIVLDITGDDTSGANRIVGEMGSNVYFIGDDSGSEDYKQLWKSDGTALGTIELNPFPDTDFSQYYSFPSPVLDGYIYFSAGDVLVRYDGMSAGVEEVVESLPGNVYFHGFASSSGTSLPVTEDYVYFITNSGEVIKLYRSDGTELGTEVVAGLPSISEVYVDEVSGLALLGDDIYFITNSVTPVGNTLMVYDGATFTKLGGLYDTEENEWFMFATEDKLFFSAGTNLYVTDGTVDGTGSILGTGSTTLSSGLLVEAGDKAFFTIDEELWVTDGTEDGTISPETVVVNSIMPHSLNGNAYFWVIDGEDNYELWKSDGTEEGTLLVKDNGTVSYSEDGENGSVVVGDKYYMLSYDEDGDTSGVLVTDGTEVGTYEVINGLTGDDAPSYITTINNGIYLINANGLQKINLDSSELEDPIVGQSFESFNLFNGKLYFILNINAESLYHSLYSTDGTDEGTSLVKHFVDDQSSDFSGELVVGENKFYVVDTYNGIWVSDGTSGGTVEVFDVVGGGLDAEGVARYFLSGDVLYFGGLGDDGYELWKSNGTESGTEFLANTGEYAFSMHKEAPFFGASSTWGGTELWTSDGTTGGTEMVEDLNPGAFSALSDNNHYASIGNTFVFMAETFENGNELHSLVWDDPEPVPTTSTPSVTSGSAPGGGRKTPSLPVANITNQNLVGPNTVTPPIKNPLILNRMLRMGMRGEDVRALQKKLNELGYTVALFGPGSPGNETSIFGPLTRATVIRFQLANGLVGDGIVGPLTLAALNN